MSRQTSITCDQCGVQKKESNHWKSAQLTPFENAEILTFCSWSRAEANSRTFDLCSEECAHRLLGKWMRGELGK